MKSIVGFIVIAFLFQMHVLSQDQNFRFERINTDNGLSKNNVYDIVQDSTGFMWFATDYGLNRYDGYDFKPYFHDEKDTSFLASNYVNSLLVDRSGNLWVGTNGCLHRYLPDKDVFVRIPLFKKKKEYQGIQYGRLIEDRDSNIWIGNFDRGLFKYDVDKRELIDLSNKVKNLGVGTIVQTDDGMIWVGTDLGKLFCIDPEDLKIYEYDNPLVPQGRLHDDYVWFVREKRGNDTLLIGSERGLFDFDRVSGKYSLHVLEGINVRDLGFTCYYADSSGMVWMGTARNGLFVVKDKNKPVLFERKPNNMMSLSNNEVHDIYRDRSGVYWVATMGGINKLDPALFFFSYYQNDVNDPNSLRFNNVSSFCEDEKHRIWVGTQGGGINVFNPDTKTFYTLKKIIGFAPSVMDRVIFDLCTSDDRNIWIATQSALDRYDQKTKRFYHYDYLKYNPDYKSGRNDYSYDGKAILSLAKGHNGDLWLGTYGGGMAHIIIGRGTGTVSFMHYMNIPGDTNSLSNDYIRKVFVDRFGVVWIGTLGTGLDRYDPENGKFTHFMHDPKDSTSISNNFVTEIYEDHFGNLWVGTYLGLNKFDREHETFSPYFKEGTEPYRMISEIFLDKKNNLWITTDNGLYRYNLKTEKVNRYSISNGLQGNNFNINALYEASDGSVYIGGRNGFNVFHPSNFHLNIYAPPVEITDIMIDNKPVHFGYGKNGIILNGGKNNIIELTYKNKVISFKFAALSYTLNKQYQYAYKMEGLNDNWVYTGNNNRMAAFTNLYPGTYYFHVKAANNDGIWNNKGTMVVIHMAVPYWKSWWAILIYLFIILGIFYLILRFVLIKRKLEEELYAERLEREKIIDINRMKIEFFSNISHEFRTPLTLILSPIESLVKSAEDTYVVKKLKLIQANAFRLLNLVNQLLDMRKAESENWTLSTERVDLIEFLEEIKVSFNELAAKKQIIFRFNIQVPRPQLIWFDKMKMKSVFYNLLSNAFKYTPDNKKISIVIRKETLFQDRKLFLRRKNRKDGEEYIVVDVLDEGVGIPKDKIDYIFDRFYTVNNESITATSTGIGLTLVKNIVLMHHGKVTVESTPGKGSRFSVYLPLGEVNRQEEVGLPEETQHSEMKVDEHLQAETPEQVKDDKYSTGKDEPEKPLILIIEDDRDIRRYIIDELKNDYNFKEATNGLEGMTIANEELPDLIISDIIMPEMDGYEMVSKFKDNIATSHIPIIFLTAKSSHEDMIEGMQTGADAYITKPFSMDILKARIDNLLMSRVKLREKFSRELLLKPGNVMIGNRDGELISRLIAIIEENMADPDFSVKTMADGVGLSRMQLYRKLKALLDKTPHELINTIRMERAAQILVQQQMTVSEVAYMVGFNTPKYFSRCFREKFGMLPTEYIKNHDGDKKKDPGTAG